MRSRWLALALVLLSLAPASAKYNGVRRSLLATGQCPAVVAINGQCPSTSADFTRGIYWAKGYGYVPSSALFSVTRAQTVNSYAATSSGLLVPFAANTLRVTDLGVLVEEARTNVATWSRDLTNATWTTSNIAVAKDQIGADGAANSASSILASAANGTILQSITLASSARFQSVYMKRLVGSGEIDMTTDNGATWTRVDSTITSTGYTRVSIPTQTLANPIIGFRIVTNGDKVAVDFTQNENGTFWTSPIPTTNAAVTRNADVITSAGKLTTAIQKSSVAIAVKALWTPNFATNPGVLLEGFTTTGLSLLTSNTLHLRATARNGSVAGARGDATSTAAAYSVGQLARVGMSFDGVTTPIGSDNGTGFSLGGAIGEADWAAPTYIGSRSSTVTNYWDNFVQRLAVFPAALSQPVLNAAVNGL